MQERAAATLDQVQLAIELIRPVNRQVEPFGLVEADHVDAQFLRQRGGPGRGRHALDAQPVLAHHFAKAPHHPCRRAASAEPDAHAVLDIFHRLLRGDEFGLIDGRQFP